jgi:hypothetical protein
MKAPLRGTLLIILLLVASTAFAGGKSSTKIKVKNCTSGPICVAVDATNADSTQDLVEAGGRYINAGCSKSFKVCAGKHTVYVVDAVEPVFPATEIETCVKKEHTEKVYYEGSNSVPK